MFDDHNKSVWEESDVKITDIYVDEEPQVGNFPKQTYEVFPASHAQ